MAADDATGRKSARRILRALIQGEDPATGKALDPDSVVHRLDVMRALALGLEALTEAAGFERRRSFTVGSGQSAKKKADRAGQGWDRTEDDELRRLFGQRRRVTDIASELGRTTGAIAARLERLGLVNARSEVR